MLIGQKSFQTGWHWTASRSTFFNLVDRDLFNLLSHGIQQTDVLIITTARSFYPRVNSSVRGHNNDQRVTLFDLPSRPENFLNDAFL